jgi:hypothetical protein
MFTMSIFGVSIVLLLGVINFFLIIFQFLSGMHYIKVNYKMHRKTGITLLVTGILHGILAVMANF